MEVTNDEPQEVIFQTDITFFDQQTNQFKLRQPEEIDQLFWLLRKHFPGVIAVMPVLPFLIIECSTVPDPAKQPFMIADLVAVFMNEGGPYPFGADFIGEMSGAKQDDPTTVPASVVGDLKPFHIPSLTTFDWLFNRIPTAIFISPHWILNRFLLNSKKQTLSNSRKHLKFCLHELDLSALVIPTVLFFIINMRELNVRILQFSLAPLMIQITSFLKMVAH